MRSEHLKSRALERALNIKSLEIKKITEEVPLDKIIDDRVCSALPFARDFRVVSSIQKNVLILEVRASLFLSVSISKHVLMLTAMRCMEGLRQLIWS